MKLRNVGSGKTIKADFVTDTEYLGMLPDKLKQFVLYESDCNGAVASLYQDYLKLGEQETLRRIRQTQTNRRLEDYGDGIPVKKVA